MYLSSVVLALALAPRSSLAEPAPGGGAAPPELALACEGGQTEACAPAGLSFARGEGTAADPARAAALFARGCDGGDMMGCALLGSLYQAGVGVARDEVRASTLLAGACDAGVRLACDAEDRPLLLATDVDLSLGQRDQASAAPPPAPPAPAAQAPAAAAPVADEPPEADEVTRSRVRRALSDVRQCVRYYGPGSQTQAGAVWATVIVSASGAVSSVAIARSTVADKRVERCITASLWQIVFPPAQGAASRVVVYPFEFGPR